MTPEQVVDAADLLRPMVGLSIVAWAVVGIGRQRDAGQRLAVGLVGALYVMMGIVAVDFMPDMVEASTGYRLQWWTYVGDAPRLAATPVDLLIPWALAWGMLPLALWSAPRPLPVVAGFGLIDVVVMPQLDMVVVLGPQWWVGELVLLAVVALPALVLVNLMRTGRRLAVRTVMLAALFSVLFLGLVPMLAQSVTGVAIPTPSAEWLTAWIQLAAIVGLPGLAAVRELYQRGRGTPYPWDPPVRVVTTGPYAYVRNPMQLAMTALMILAAVALWYWPLAVGAVTALVFSVSVAEPHEQSVLGRRWRSDWARYVAEHRNWRPTWRPVFSGDGRAVVYVDGGCEVCRAVGEWLTGQQPTALQVADARYAPGPLLDRLSYRWVDAEGRVEFEAKGVAAFAAAVEHINVGWAALGWGLRLPVVGWLAQAIADAVIMAPHLALPPDLPPLATADSEQRADSGRSTDGEHPASATTRSDPMPGGQPPRRRAAFV